MLNRGQRVLTKMGWEGFVLDVSEEHFPDPERPTYSFRIVTLAEEPPADDPAGDPPGRRVYSHDIESVVL